MPENLAELENILNEELRIFNNILHLEKEKSEAILNKDGILMESLSRVQEQYLCKITPIENKRKNLTDKYLNNNPDKKLTLTDIASIEDAAGSNLGKVSGLLKKTLDKIKSLQETNTQMINDNLDFFKKMINKLRETASMETGYSDKGVDRGKAVNSLLVNKKI